MPEGVDNRKKQFLDWAEAERVRIGEIKFPRTCGRDRLREVKKTVIIALLDTLSTSFNAENPPDHRTPFARLVEDSASWDDATRISVVHLSRAVDLHLQLCDKNNTKMRRFREFLHERSPWLSEKDPDERNIGDDPTINEVLRQWPGSSSEPLVVPGRALHLWDFKHSYLLYRYRNFLVHESREPTFSQEDDDEKTPVYMVVKKTASYHLVYPLFFLMSLTQECIRSLRYNPSISLRRLKYGTYLIPELNE